MGPSPDIFSSDYIVIGVQSRKGGVGKTTAALVLAHLLAEDKYPGPLIDGDITGTIRATLSNIHRLGAVARGP